MDCTQTEKHLLSYLDQSFDPALAGQISDHLKECPQCSLQAQKLQQVLQLIPNMKQSNPNAFLFTRIEQQINAGAQQEPLTVFTRIFHPILVSVLMIATVLVGLYFFQPGAEPETMNTANQSSVIASQYHMNPSDQDIIETYYLTEE